MWLIASSLSDEVAYHIDYAEILRYQTNIIHPPLYGATLHLTPVAVGRLPVDQLTRLGPL